VLGLLSLFWCGLLAAWTAALLGFLPRDKKPVQASGA
jgi:hypothetical protein